MDSENIRLAKNTIVMYVRMFITILIGLYASRLSLQILGIEDYGIYNIVGGIVSLFSFISNSMAISVQRYYSIELGKNNIDKLCEIFSVSVIIHSFIAVLVFILAEIVGGFIIKEYLNIPENRSTAAFLSYQCIVCTIIVNIIQVPFNGLIVAYEKLKIFAYIGVLESILKLGLLLLLREMSVDKLVWYAFFMFITSLFVAASYNIYCKRIIKEVKFRVCFRNNIYKEMFNFAGWTAVGEISWTFVSQGVNIILNLFFGPALNAARGISTQVQSLVMRFVQNFQSPLNPQIIKSYAVSNYDRTLSLFYNGTLYSYYLVLFIAVPLIFNMEYLLQIWLGEFPPYSVLFCRLTILGFLLDTLGNLVHPIIKANGSIRKFHIVISLILFLNFPLSYFSLKLGLSPYSVLYVYCLVSVIALFVKLFMLHNVIYFTVRDYIIQVLKPVIQVTILYLITPSIFKILGSEGDIFYLIFNIILTSIVGLIIFYYVGITEQLRIKIRFMLFSKLNIK